MPNCRLTVRLPNQDMQVIDMFVKTGEFTTRSEFIRRAVREYQRNHMKDIIDKTEALKKLQNMVQEIEYSNEFLKK